MGFYYVKNEVKICDNLNNPFILISYISPELIYHENSICKIYDVFMVKKLEEN